jgi:RecG-like helicase
MFDQLSSEILASLIKGFPTTRTTITTTTTTKQNVDPAVHFVYSRVKNALIPERL